MCLRKTPMRCWQYQGLDPGQLVPMWAAGRLQINWDQVELDSTRLHPKDWVVEVDAETEKTEPILVIYPEQEFIDHFAIVAAPVPVAGITAQPKGETT